MDKLLKYGGIVLMVIGILAVISAFPLISLSVVSVGPVSADVPQISATRIIVGVVLAALGYFAYAKGK